MNLSFALLADADIMRLLMTGVGITLRLFAGALIGGFALALLLTAVNLVPSRVVRGFVAVYVEYHRNVPTVVQILVWYFGMPEILPVALRDWINAGNSEFSFALIALSLGVSAYYYEDIRSGIRAIPATQVEAARAIGLNAVQALGYVILPQAVRVAVPPLVNRSVILLKDTSLAMVIGVTDLTYQTKHIENTTFQTFEIFTVATLVYLCLALSVSGLGAWLARTWPASFVR